ncbi:MAG: hypothetical protein ACO1RT_15605 [Planctomycetaceae bacterium]
MTHQTPHSLLSLPPDMASPEAYLVLGLPQAEPDRDRIKAAADYTMARLHAAKATADPEAWATAAQWVKSAYAILGDASKKAAYDRKLASESTPAPPAVDPLAGLLPGTSGGPAFHPGHVSRSPSVAPVPSGAPLAPSAAVFHPAMGEPHPAAGFASQTATVQVPVVKGRSSIKRRRGLPWVPILLSLFSLATIAGLGAVIYVVQNSDPIVVNTSGGPLIGSMVDPDGDGRAVSPPMDVTAKQKQPFDPVMGGLAGDMPIPSASPGAVNEPPTSSPLQVNAAVPDPRAMADERMTPNSEMAASPMSQASPEMTAMSPDAGPAAPMMDNDVASPAAPVPAPPTAEQVNAGEAALAAVTAAIVSHQWDKMKPLSETAAAAAASESQKELAEDLLQLVDLAVYYRGGIEKSISTLQAGNELDLTNDLKVVIVEASSDKLVIRFNGRNKEYTFDALPLSLAHKLAVLSMPGDSPTTQAAKYAFQAVAPVTTAPYREAAIAELENIDGEVEGAEPARLVAAIRHVYNL